MIRILLALAIIANAQSISETESARAHRLLNSPQWIDKAWGVYFAGHLHSAEFQGSLLEALREAAPLRHALYATEEHGYVAALFDAAIESGIAVPSGVLEPFEATDWRAQVIILLARDAGAEETLLRLREQPELGEPEWTAVSNLLLARKSGRFFAKTLSEVNISHTFTLTDPGDLTGEGGGVGGGSCGDGVASMPKGFPPVALYEILNSAQAGDVFLADGPEKSYYRKFVVPTDKQIGIGACGPWGNRDGIRVGYLARMAELPESEAEALFHAQTHMEFHPGAKLTQQIEQSLKAQESAIRAFAKAMTSVAGMTLKIEPKIDDQRKSTDGPAPQFTAREFVLE